MTVKGPYKFEPAEFLGKIVQNLTPNVMLHQPFIVFYTDVGGELTMMTNVAIHIVPDVLKDVIEQTNEQLNERGYSDDKPN